jgi:2',3'-cyclic-nucleotide 2'-phosphodiesterase (5'-nucleotidase family)
MMTASAPALAAGGTAPAATAAENTTSATATQATGETNLTVLAYTDLGSAASGTDGKLGRFITTLEDRRATADGGAIVVGNGDEISPHALRTLVDDAYLPPVKALNTIDPAAEAVQNHELDYDEDEETGDFSIFERASNASEFPWVLANARKNGSGLPGTQNYTVVERNGVSVGIFAVADDGLDSKAGNVLTRNGWHIEDPIPTAQRIEQRLTEEEDVDVVIALAPVGVDTATQLAEQTDEVDVVVSGDTDETQAPTTAGGAIVTQPESGANGFAEVNLTVANGDVTAAEGRLVETRDDVERNTTWADYIDPIRDEFGFNTVVAETEVSLEAGAAHYDTETAMGNVIADGVRNFTGADVALTNAGGIRGGTSTGETVTGGDIRATLPFGNTVITMEMTGAELKAVLKSQMTTLDSTVIDGPGIASQVSGVRFEWVPQGTPEEQDEEDVFEGHGVVRDVYVNGEPLNESATYSVATNSYIASGSSGYPMSESMWTEEYNTTFADAVIGYLEREGTLTEEEIDPEVQTRMRRVTRDATGTSVETDGDSVVVTATVPEPVTGVAGDFTFRNVSGGQAVATDVSFDEATDEVVVTFDRGAFAATNGPGAEVYGEVEDSEYGEVIRSQSSYEYAVLNVDVPEVDVQPETGLARFDGTAGEADGEITPNEVLNAIVAYNQGTEIGGTEVTSQDVLDVIVAYNSGQPV